MPREVFDAVRGTHSPGQAFNALMKGHEPAPVARWTDRGRFYADGSEHVCPISAAQQAPRPGT